MAEQQKDTIEILTDKVFDFVKSLPEDVTIKISVGTGLTERISVSISPKMSPADAEAAAILKKGGKKK